MAAGDWQTRRVAVASLHLDPKNPRLGSSDVARTPRDVIQYLFEHDKASEIAESIASRGYFPNEPLLAIDENGRLVVVEGNRRLAALKALREPTLLSGTHQRSMERLANRLPTAITHVPVTVAPNRRSTDRQIAGRHIGTPVLAWEAENRANFILAKLAEGYDDDELKMELGFTPAEVQKARQTKAIADMARSLNLPDAVKAKLDNPRAQVFTTIGRVFDSTVGRQYLGVEPDAEHGIRGTTTKDEFVKTFTRLVTDVAKGQQSSRTLNTNDNIKAYFKKWKPKGPNPKGAFLPSEVTTGKTTSAAKPAAVSGTKRTKKESNKVMPRSFHVHHGNPRLVKMRNELCSMDRTQYENAGAVLLRVFLELAIEHYLHRKGELAKLVAELKAKGAMRHGKPELSHMIKRIVPIAKGNLPSNEAIMVEKALRYDQAAPFSIRELHDFVHSTDQPSPRDIKTFWNRTEPLFRMMLEQD